MAFNLKSERVKELINNLRSSGIRDDSVLEAMQRLKRESFVVDEFKKFAYDNSALPIECSQTISQPFTVAFMTQLLKVKKGSKILEIGTGSGYQAALLCELGAEVYSVERIEALYKKAKNTLNKLGYRVNLLFSDGSLGWKENAPFDGIIVTAGSPDIPQKLLEQLKPEGILIVPVGDKYVQKMYEVKKIPINGNEHRIDIKKHGDFKFVPLVGDDGWK